MGAGRKVWTISPGNAPATDAEVAGFAKSLGIPGIFDVHVHFMPKPVMDKVWQYFDRGGELVGRKWPINYQGSDQDRVEQLTELSVRHFSTLCYAHKPGMAAWLNDWTLEFAEQYPQVLASATFYPEDGVLDYARAAIARGARVCKIHVQVGNFDLNDARLGPVWSLLTEQGIPTVLHVGSGPVAGAHTGPSALARLMADHPELPVIVAHLGMPEEADFLAMAADYPNMYFDTTMVGTDFMRERHQMTERSLAQVGELGLAGRVLFGSDFPNIPYPFAHQVEVLAKWGLGAEWLRKVLWQNAAYLWQMS